MFTHSPIWNNFINYSTNPFAFNLSGSIYFQSYLGQHFSPLPSVRLFYMYVRQLNCFISSLDFSKILYHWKHIGYSLFRQFISLAKCTWKFINVFSWLDSPFFLFLIKVHCVDVSQFTHSPTERQDDCVQVSTFTNETAVNIHVKVFLWT